jgi:hypothetical protein
VFARVPAEQRLRCAEVCRGWRATLADATLWAELEFQRDDDSVVSDALLHAAAARASGRLRVLRVGRVVRGALHAVAAANAASLRELYLDTLLRCAELEALLRAAPQLRVLQNGAALSRRGGCARSTRARVRRSWLDVLAALSPTVTPTRKVYGLAAEVAGRGG